MIILAPSLIITPSFAYPNTYPVIGWHNQVVFGQVVADYAEAAYPASNLANPLTSKVWLSSSTAVQLVTVNGLDGETDYVAIARHNFGSTGATISVEAITAEPGADWEVVFPGAVLADDAPVMLLFPAGYYASVRLRIVPNGIAPSAAVLYVGQILRMQRGVQPGFVPLRDAAVPDTVEGLSESGEFLGAIVNSQSRSTSVDFKALERDWYNANVRPFVIEGNRKRPFFFAWNPEQYPDDVGFCWFSSSNVRPNTAYMAGQVDLSIPMGGLGL